VDTMIMLPLTLTTNLLLVCKCYSWNCEFEEKDIYLQMKQPYV